MTAAEIVAEAEQIGLKLTVESRELVVRGSGTRPPLLLDAIRQNKAVIVALLRGRASLKRDESELSEESSCGILKLPSNELPLAPAMPVLTPEERKHVIHLVMQRGKAAIGWCMARANAYFQKFPDSTVEDQDTAAALDLLRSCGEE